MVVIICATSIEWTAVSCVIFHMKIGEPWLPSSFLVGFYFVTDGSVQISFDLHL